MIKELEIIKKKLRDGELNPGLPRDRRGYSPLYYLGYCYLYPAKMAKVTVYAEEV